MEPEKKHKYLPVLITIFVMLLLTAGSVIGVWYYMDQQAENDKAELQSQINDLKSNISSDTTEEATDTEDDVTADWKTYTNSKKSYTVKYPNSLAVTETNTEDAIWAMFCYEPFRSGGDCVVWSIAEYENSTLAEIKEERVTNTGQVLNNKIIKSENITFNDIEAVKYTTTADVNYTNIVILFSDGRNVYAINGSGDISSGEFRDNDFKSFYESFKFTK